MTNSVTDKAGPAGVPPRPPALLIVEDDKDSREMLLMVIRKLFPELVIHCARDGKAGWELFQAHTPEVVITDLNMPEMDGLQMAGMIRSHTPGTKLVALSAHIERAAMEGSGGEVKVFDSFIVKPFKFSTLVAEIEEILPKGPRADCLAQLTPALLTTNDTGGLTTPLPPIE
jgi:CheY-like chemotaxis protein